MSGELGDAGSFFGAKVDDVGVAIAALVRTVGDLGGIRGELGAVAEAFILGQLTGVGAVDVGNINLLHLGFFSAGGGGKRDPAGGKSRRPRQSLHDGIREEVSGPASVPGKTFIHDGGAPGLGHRPTGKSRRGNGTGKHEGGGIRRDHPANTGAVEVIGQDFGGSDAFRPTDGLDGDVNFAGLLDDNDRGGGLGVDNEGKKAKKRGEESHRERQQHGNQISSGK